MGIVQKTIGRMINEVVGSYPNYDALIHTEIGFRYTYDLFLWEIDRTSRGMMRLGIQRGDKVALWAPNIPEWLIVQMATAKIGAILVPIDTEAEIGDLEYILFQSDAKAIILARGVEGEEYVEMISSVKDKMPLLEQVVVIATQSFPDMLHWRELAAMGMDVDMDQLTQRECEVSPRDPVAIMFTSGTTGRPKGVVLDHVGLINKSLDSARRQGLNHEDRLCLFFPLFHMFGNTCIALAGLLRGASIIMPCLTFDPSRILKAIHKEQCTAIYGSPSMIIALLDHPEFNKKRWRTVKKGTMGGAPCPMELMKRIVKDVGVRDITVGYGITEASSWITMTKPHDPLELRVSTIGTPLESNQVKLISTSTGETLPPNRQGELCIKGLLMKEYYKMPAATASAVDRDGWFHSGDLGEMDENGYIKITGRLKDVIIRKGKEIYPAEVEEILYGLPEVSEVQVFGFMHPDRGQEVAAWIKLKEGADLSPNDISQYAASRLESEKAPHYYRVVNAFPMTRSGKVQKFKLTEMAEKEYGYGSFPEGH